MVGNLGSGKAPLVSGKRGQAFHEIRNFKNYCFAPNHYTSHFVFSLCGHPFLDAGVS